MAYVGGGRSVNITYIRADITLPQWNGVRTALENVHKADDPDMGFSVFEKPDGTEAICKIWNMRPTDNGPWDAVAIEKWSETDPARLAMVYSVDWQYPDGPV